MRYHNFKRSSDPFQNSGHKTTLCAANYKILNIIKVNGTTCMTMHFSNTDEIQVGPFLFS